MKKEIDFTVKGTKLPMIPEGTRYRTQSWSDGAGFDRYSSDRDYYVSFGQEMVKGEMCILAETIQYGGSNCFQIPLSEIQKLAKEQNMIETRKLIGYLLPFEIPSFKWIKGDVLFLSTMLNREYYVPNKKGTLPKEVVEQWEAVYEENVVKLRLGSSKTPFEISAYGVFVDGGWVELDDIEKLLYPKIDLIKPSRFPNAEQNMDSISIELIEAKYKIGCSTFTLDDINQIINTMNKIRE